MCACLCLPTQVAPEAVLLPGSQPGRQVRREKLALVFREGFELERFTFHLKPQPLDVWVL